MHCLDLVSSDHSFFRVAFMAVVKQSNDLFAAPAYTLETLLTDTLVSGQLYFFNMAAFTKPGPFFSTPVQTLYFYRFP